MSKLNFTEIAFLIESQAGNNAEELRAGPLLLAFNLAADGDFHTDDVLAYARGVKNTAFEQALMPMLTMYSRPGDCPLIRRAFRAGVEQGPHAAWRLWQREMQARYEQPVRALIMRSATKFKPE